MYVIQMSRLQAGIYMVCFTVYTIQCGLLFHPEREHVFIVIGFEICNLESE